MRFGIVGAGAVGGYYGALLARAGHDVAMIARGAHLDALRAGGIAVRSEAVGDFVAHVTAEADPSRVGPVDTVIFAVKTYDNASALPLVRPLVGASTSVLTLQNGVESAEMVAEAVGAPKVLAGATYVATAIESPGVIRQTGSHRRIVFGEWFHPADFISSRVDAIARAMQTADIQVEPVADARVPIWEKFVYLAPFAAFTGAARLPIGPIAADFESRAAFLQAVAEVDAVARASGIRIAADTRARIEKYLDDLPASTRSSLLIDLSQGKRIEIETLAGSVVRRGRAVGVATPMMCALYAVLRPWAEPRA
jgi:2-dehydropantoate 2-reductase